MNVSYLGSFAAGVLTFFTPCILPMIPLYLAFLTGKRVADLGNEKSISDTVRFVFPFCAGFTLVFVLLGASASFLGQFVGEHQAIFRRITAVIIFAFALYFLKLIPQPMFLQKDARLISKVSGKGIGSSFLFGAAFAFGWTPCVGPILASVLAVAAFKETVSTGIFLLLFYSIGLSVPLFAVTLLADQLLPLLKKISPLIPKIETVCGIVLFQMGIWVWSA